MLDSTRLLCELQQVNQLGQDLSGCLDPSTIANRITQTLVEHFDCAFARVWLTDPDQKALTLVASSGLYTHINGSFAHVPMGAYKVGKIAQNHVPFLSNQLAQESWVKDRNWAIANNIQGFAGYPLLSGDRVLGVLATFSHEPFALEFLEVLQVLCLTATIALDAAIQAQQQQNLPQIKGMLSLSDQLAQMLGTSQLTLIGTERTLPISTGYVVLRLVEQLRQLSMQYCRLTYGRDRLSLEAIVAIPDQHYPCLFQELTDIQRIAADLGGTCLTQQSNQDRVFEMVLELPYTPLSAGLENKLAAFSEREHQVMTLLAQGHRDRDIAQKLHISESTVKFHLNNALTKLKAKNRYQAVYEATSRAWI